jgi:PQQ-dependent catabolism-associated CXXCW motif protein
MMVMITGDEMLSNGNARRRPWPFLNTIIHRYYSSLSLITIFAIVTAAVIALSPALAVAQEKSYGGEDRDWNVAPTAELRTADYHAPTPRTIPGGRVVRTTELEAMREVRPQPYLIDVLGGDAHRTIAGAFWLAGAGAGDMNADEARRFLDAVAKFAGGDRNRPIVFFCADSQCWLSYNAALRAIAAGYTNIMWFRGGLAAWFHAGLPMTQSEPFAW